MKPVLEAARLRVDVDGVPQVEGLSFETTGDRVLVLAGPPALFQAAAGIVRPRGGELRTSGVSPTAAVRERLMACAPLDPPLPLAWKALDYVAWSARLAGVPKRDALDLAARAIDRLHLQEVAKLHLRYAPLHARRALGVAAAVATGATTLFLEDPLRGLPDDAARSLARLVVKATLGLRTVIFAARTSLASPIAIDADEAVVLDDGAIVAQGAPAEVASLDRSYAIRLHGRGASFAKLAELRGARVSGQGARWTVDLGATLRVNDLLDVAHTAGTVLLELRPLGRAFA